MKGRKRLERLPPRYKRVLKALRKAEEQLGTTPAVREVVATIAEDEGQDKETAIADLTSSVHKDLHNMHELNLVERLPTPTRCWRIRDGVNIDEIDWEKLLL